jgi:hypothetical protein
VALTRRTLLRRLAGAGAISLLTPSAALSRAGIGAGGPRGDVFSVPVGSFAGESALLRAPRAFVLAGVQWDGPAGARIQLRARSAEGVWSRWVVASAIGHDSEGETAQRSLFGEPLWTGAADAVQLRTSGRVHGVRVHFVNIEAPAAGALATAAAGPPLATPVLDAGPGQPAIIARRAWAGAAGPAVPPTYGSVMLAFVHHTVNPNGYSAAEVSPMLYAIYLFHRYTRGWNDIGYNFLIDAFGRTWEGRAGGIDQAVVGAQAGGYNLESTGVAMLGTFSDVLPTPAARAALERLLAWKLSLHGLPTLGHVTVEVNPTDAFYTPFAPGSHVSLPRVAGHRDGCSTGCPGDDLYAHLPAIRPVVARLAGSAAALTLTLSGGRVAPASYLSLAGSELVAGKPLALSGHLSSLAGGASGSAPSGSAPIGSAATGSAPIGTAPIQVQQLTTSVSSGAAIENTIARAITAADGSWSVSLSPSVNLLMRAVHTASPASVSPLVWVAVAPAITLSRVPYSPGGPGEVSLLGTVTPHKRAVTVVAERDGAGRRTRPLTKTVAVVNGRFEATLDLRVAGVYRVRAETDADASNVAGSSPPLVVTV